jgi:hypothetical protein
MHSDEISNAFCRSSSTAFGLLLNEIKPALSMGAANKKAFGTAQPLIQHFVLQLIDALSGRTTPGIFSILRT